MRFTSLEVDIFMCHGLFKGIMIGGFLWKMRKIFFSLFKLRRLRKAICKKNGEKKAFLLFTIKRKTICKSLETSYGALTALIKIHRQLSHVMRIAVWYFICARELFSIWLLHRKSAFVLVKFSLCLDKNAQENFLLIFVSEETEEAKIWWNQQVQRRTRSLAPDLSDRGSHCFKLRRMVEGTPLVPPMKLKVKIQQVLVARNCWRTDAIPKLPQRESQAQM